MKLTRKATDISPILDVPVSRLGFDQVLEDCLKRGKHGEGGYICFVNVHSLIEAHWNPQVKKALSESHLSVADGMPLVWTSRFGTKPIASRVCGPDLMQEFLRYSGDWTHGFIGGPPGQAESLAQKLGVKAICYSPPMRPFSPEHAREDWESFLAKCSDGRPPSVVWIGLGAPKQELWMNAVSACAPSTLFFGVGAAFDFLKGNKKRAPLWMQNNGLEWLFRLSQEPLRLWRRYLLTNSLFLWLLSVAAFKKEFYSISGILGVQLALTWFAPSIGLGERSLFLGDLWCLIWSPLLLAKILFVDKGARKKWLPWVVVSAMLALLSWAHGIFRPDQTAKFTEFEMFHSFVIEPFAPGRELVISLRFLSWFWAGLAVSIFPFRSEDFRSLGRWFTAFTVAASTSMVACKLWPSLSFRLGAIYGYDPQAYPWAGRIFGIFRGPNEAGISLGLAAVLMLGMPEMRNRARQGVSVLALVGTALAQSMSAFLLSLTISFLEWRRKRSAKVQLLAMVAISISLCALVWWLSQTIGLEHKLASLSSRIGPWEVFTKISLQRWDYFLLGFGYTQIHVDNSYLFFLNRGGILFLGGMLWMAWRTCANYWRRWSFLQRGAFVYLLISSLMLDTLIIRPLVALLIAVCIPMLKPETTEVAKQAELNS